MNEPKSKKKIKSRRKKTPKASSNMRKINKVATPGKATSATSIPQII